MKTLALIALLVSFSAPAFAGKDKPAYEAGTFVENRRMSDGTYSNASCGRYGCSGSAYSASHNVHFVTAPEGRYAIAAPVSVGGTILVGMLSDGYSPTIHKVWFMDNLHEGDTVLFSAQCNKHNRCTIRLPNPDNPKKEFVTEGSFDPNIAKTNKTVLCGTGKLTAAVEAQMCSSAPAPAAPVPAPAAVAPSPAVPIAVAAAPPPMVVVSADPEPESLGNYARRMKAEKAAQ